MFTLAVRNLRVLRFYKLGNWSGMLERNLYSSDTTSSVGIFIPSYSPKPGETPDERKARLLYQSRKRGMLENDLLFSTFINKYLLELNNELIIQYDNLINSSYSDWDIYYWIIGARPVPSEFDNEIMQLLKEHVKNKTRERRLRQPDLPNYVFDK